MGVGQLPGRQPRIEGCHGCGQHDHAADLGLLPVEARVLASDEHHRARPMCLHLHRVYFRRADVVLGLASASGSPRDHNRGRPGKEG